MFTQNHPLFKPLVVVMLDPIEHTDDHPYCLDPYCPCKADPDLFAQHIAGPLDRGELTMREAVRLFFGRMI